MRHIVRLLTVIVLLAALSGLPSSTSASAGTVQLSGFPLLRQQHSLTCESSAASMATRGVLSESQIMGILPRNPNPNWGFRGNPDGQQGTALVDYGVYALPVQKALLQFGYQSSLISYGGDTQIRSYVKRGWPVVAWITYALQPATPRLAKYAGVHFILVPHEHTVLITGYGNGYLLGNDPWTAKRVRYSWSSFNRSWGYFGNMALAIAPCPVPAPVSNLSVTTASTAGITWAWHPVRRATRYRVKVIQIGPVNRVVYNGTQTAALFTLPNPLTSTMYRIVVTSIASCGSVSDSAVLEFLTPSTLPAPPTPTPTATPSPTVVPESPRSTT